MNSPTTSTDLLQVVDVYKYYPVFGGVFKHEVAQVKAVTGVSFSIKEGEAIGLVGESGCGKSTLGRAIMGLEKPTQGHIFFGGADIANMSDRELRLARRDFQMIFQDPFSSLNPRMTVFKLIAEPIRNFHPKIGKKELVERVEKLMVDVGLKPYEHAGRYPHEFSGGQRQRISIGRALAAGPKLIVCDEPVSALDVSIQAQVLNLLMSLKEKYSLSLVFISHDLHVVKHVSNKIAVMYLGRFVELGSNEEIYLRPKHPYSRALLSAVPVAKTGEKKQRIILQGDVPSPINPPTGCAFHPRCPYAVEECKRTTPQLEEISSKHFVSCIRAKELNL